MRSRTTIFSFKKLPAVVIAILAMIVGTEWYIYANRPSILQDYWNKFLINEHVLVDQSKGFDYLIIGDSIQKTGINPALVDSRVLSLGMPGGKPLSLYLLLERYLRHHKPPKTVFLYVDPEDAHDSLLVILRFFMTVPEAISVWGDLTRQERQVFLMRYWASLDLRKVGLTVRDLYPDKNDVFIKTLISNCGYMSAPSASRALPADYFSSNKERVQNKVSFTNIDRKYLDKFMALAASKNIRVVFLGFLQPKELYAIHERTGFNGEYSSFYDTMKTRYPEAVFVDEPLTYMDNSYFGDISHVNEKGVPIYSEYFKKKVFLPNVF